MCIQSTNPQCIWKVEAELHISESCLITSPERKCWFQAVMCISTPMMYLKSGYFLLLYLLYHMRFQNCGINLEWKFFTILCSGLILPHRALNTERVYAVRLYAVCMRPFRHSQQQRSVCTAAVQPAPDSLYQVECAVRAYCPMIILCK